MVFSFIDSWYANTRPIIIIRDTLLIIIVLYCLFKLYNTAKTKGLKKALVSYAIAAIEISPGANKVAEKIEKDLRKSLIPDYVASLPINYELPENGQSPDKILSDLSTWSKGEVALWGQGKASGSIYHGDQVILETANKAYSYFALSNPLHPELFPYVRKMESEVISMTLSLFNGYNTCCGQMTSGGTESILLAVKAYRDYAKAEKGIIYPELIACTTAHAAFDKACGYFGIKLISLKPDENTKRLNIDDVKKAITSNTIALVGSAPTFPHGVVDPIPQLSQIAIQHNIGLHVDCCLGSFMVPFAQGYGCDIPLFDFRLPGVTSISADTHKYGYSPKGSSVIMYSNNKLRHYMYYVTTNWIGGIYASPTIAGSRPGSIVAATWATLMQFGRLGYKQHAEAILDVSNYIRNEFKTNKLLGGDPKNPSPNDIVLVGDSKLSVIAFGIRHQVYKDYNINTNNNNNSTTEPLLNIFSINSAMGKLSHWHLNTLQTPSCIHICVTWANHKKVKESFIPDLLAAKQACIESTKYDSNTNTQLYGVAEAIALPDTDEWDGNIQSNQANDSLDQNKRKNNIIGMAAMAYIDTLTWLPPRENNNKDDNKKNQ